MHSTDGFSDPNFIPEEVGESKTSQMTSSQLMAALKNPAFKQNLADNGKMSEVVVWQIFRKLDVFEEGCIDMNLFVEGLLRSRQQLQNEDLVIQTLMMLALRNDASR